MDSPSFVEGDVLWIDHAVDDLPDLVDGFAFLVQDFLGWADPGRAVWVRGTVVSSRRTGARLLTLCVPIDQPRAELTPRAPRHAVTPHPTAAVTVTNRPVVEDAGLVGPPPGYQRRVFR